MLKLCRVTKVKVLFLVLVYVFNISLFEFSAAILEKSLLPIVLRVRVGYEVITPLVGCNHLISDELEWNIYFVLFKKLRNTARSSCF